MYSGKYFECILVYSALDNGVSRKNSFISQDTNLALRSTHEIMILKNIFHSKIDDAGDDKYYEYYNMSASNVNMNLNSYDFTAQ